jgi:DNA polymerase-1
MHTSALKQHSHYQLILVDGSSYLYRAFHALPPLANSQGKPTGAIYGVVSMLRKLLTDYPVEHVAVVFDTKGKTFRDTIFPEYKAHRSEMPIELQQQITPLHQIICAMGLPLIMVEGVEADDVIGTLAKQASQQGMKTLISTVDKDFAQLVDADVTLMNTMTNSWLDVANVEEKFGIPPHLIIDYLTLVGDAVDNIPGVPNVGPKTAVKWLKNYGSLQNILDHAAEITGKVGENLRASIAFLPMSKKLVTIDCEVPLTENLSTLCRTAGDNEVLAQLYKTLEFKQWLADLSPQPVPVEHHYETILTEAAFSRWLSLLEKAPFFSIHTQTTPGDYLQAKLVGLSFAVSAGEAAYLPLAHDYPEAPQQLDRKVVLQQLKPLLEDARKLKVGQNLKYDSHILANMDIFLDGILSDSMLESYVLNSASARHELDNLSLKHLHHHTIPLEAIAGKGAKQSPFNQVPVEKAAPYAAEAADIVLQLHMLFSNKLDKEPSLKKVLTEIEIPLLSVLSRMEQRGVLIDVDKLKTHSKELGERLQQLETEAYQLANQNFNLNSPKQLQEILFEKQKLPVLEKTPTGQASTGESVLQELALNYPLPKLILQYRTLSKLKSTYTDRLPQQVNVNTGRVHTCYQQAVAATGRLSSIDPNLQNIPIKTEEGRRIREAFIAPKQYCIVSADYSQIELRIMAHLSGDNGLIKAFQNDLDIHQATAAEVLGIPLESVSSEQRRSAKAINFGLLYGMSSFGLAKQLNVSREAAQTYIDLYFERYPQVKIYMENIRQMAKKQGYVETLFGRRLYLLDINASNLQRQRAAERAAINAPMQGTAADIIKRAMISLDKVLPTSAVDAFMIMQAHDELVFEVLDKDVETLVAIVKDHMMQAANLDVPLVVNVGVGSNWNQAH